ncbi:hypothetical protein B0J14DRAFT_672111 [Halenospora varia]|nr:hypothetical protein B0J14DRAFT_672111 [Halenospora varia]
MSPNTPFITSDVKTAPFEAKVTEALGHNLSGLKIEDKIALAYGLTATVIALIAVVLAYSTHKRTSRMTKQPALNSIRLADSRSYLRSSTGFQKSPSRSFRNGEHTPAGSTQTHQMDREMVSNFGNKSDNTLVLYSRELQEMVSFQDAENVPSGID